MLMRSSSTLLSWLLQLLYMYLARPRERGVEAWGAGKKSMVEDGAPRCGASALGRLVSCSFWPVLFITTVMACKLMCDHRRERQCNYGAYLSVCGLCWCIYFHVDPDYLYVLKWCDDAALMGELKIQRQKKWERRCYPYTYTLSHTHIHTFLIRTLI